MSTDKAPLHRPTPNPKPCPENANYKRSPLRNHGTSFSIDGSVLYEMAHHHLTMNPAKEAK